MVSRLYLDLQSGGVGGGSRSRVMKPNRPELLAYSDDRQRMGRSRQALYLIGARIGRQVGIRYGIVVQEQIPNRASHHIEFIALVTESLRQGQDYLQHYAKTSSYR
jgi:hypothetical protein